MSGPAWAAASGVGFGVFQTLNRRALLGMDAYVGTFVQLVIAAVVLCVASAATQDVSLLGHGSGGLVWFALAGIVHFFGGWTFLNLSQQRVGAARTSPLISATPVFGVVVAAATIHERPSASTLVGIAVIVAGVYAVALERLGDRGRPPARDAVFGLATALCWSISPVLIKHGLESFPSPLLGLTVGMLCALVLYAVAIPVSGRSLRAPWGEALGVKLVAGLFVGVSVWARWVSLDRASVGVVLALGLLSVPVVIAFSPLVVGRELERVTRRVVAGAALVVGGSLFLVALA